MFVHWQHDHDPQVQRDARVIANAGQFAKCTRHRLSSSSSTAGGSIECLCSYLLLLADDFQRGVPPTATRAHIPARVVEHGNQLKAETNDAAQPKPAGGPDRLLRTGCHTSKARLQTHHTSHRHPGLHAPRGSRLSQCQVVASSGEEFPPGLRSQAVGRAKLFVVERRVYSICPCRGQDMSTSLTSARLTFAASFHEQTRVELVVALDHSGGCGSAHLHTESTSLEPTSLSPNHRPRTPNTTNAKKHLLNKAR
ncbi:hypothetical protein CSPX01_00163 [Colletotrichum filicis]|nr:hypothetical protein CSPX01_00163 [Colletotrichum filicis]